MATPLACTLYHALPRGRANRGFCKLEHGAIFVLIAGTYTPFTLVALYGVWGWTLFGLIWTLVAIGMLLKAVATTSHRWLPGILYLALAWLIASLAHRLGRSVALAPRAVCRRDVVARRRHLVRSRHGVLRCQTSSELPLCVPLFRPGGYVMPLCGSVAICSPPIRPEVDTRSAEARLAVHEVMHDLHSLITVPSLCITVSRCCRVGRCISVVLSITPRQSTDTFRRVGPRTSPTKEFRQSRFTD
jgi:hypothetical protein